MTIDYMALWILTLANTLAILLVVRQLALLPKYQREPGPRVGVHFDDWSLRSLTGKVVTGSEMAAEYVLLFTASGCGPCHALFGQLAREGRPQVPLVVAAEGDAAALARVATAHGEPLYDTFLGGLDADLLKKLQIPSTPFAVAVRMGRVLRSGPARTRGELQKVADALAPQVVAQPART